MKLVASKEFEQKYKRIITQKPRLKNSIDNTLKMMQKDINLPALEKRKLSDNLNGLTALYCGYNCNNIYRIEKSTENDDEIILLIDFASRKEIF